MAARSPFPRTAVMKTETGARDSRSSIPCQFFAQRRCRNRENCPFSHDTGTVEQLRTQAQSLTDVRGTASDNMATFGDGGTGRSDDAAPRSSGDSRSRVPCQFFLRGSCLKREKCPFAHNLNVDGNDTQNILPRGETQTILGPEVLADH